MKQAGQVVLFRFPHADLEEGKLRPALLLRRLPGEYDDWLTYDFVTGAPLYPRV